LAKGWRTQLEGATMCGCGSRYLCLYYSWPVRDNVAQSYHHQGRGQRSWPSAYTTCVLRLFHADILPRHYPYVGHLKSTCCLIICCPAGSKSTSMFKLTCGGMDTTWKPDGTGGPINFKRKWWDPTVCCGITKSPNHHNPPDPFGIPTRGTEIQRWAIIRGIAFFCYQDVKQFGYKPAFTKNKCFL